VFLIRTMTRLIGKFKILSTYSKDSLVKFKAPSIYTKNIMIKFKISANYSKDSLEYF